MRRVDAGTERRLADAFARRLRAPATREAAVDAAMALVFVAGAVALAASAHAARPLSPLLAVPLTVALAVVGRVEFSSGSGFATPTQVVFVPMLLLLPTPLVPLLTAAALVGSSLVDALRGRSAIVR